MKLIKTSLNRKQFINVSSFTSKFDNLTVSTKRIDKNPRGRCITIILDRQLLRRPVPPVRPIDRAFKFKSTTTRLHTLEHRWRRHRPSFGVQTPYLATVENKSLCALVARLQFIYVDLQFIIIVHARLGDTAARLA